VVDLNAWLRPRHTTTFSF